MNNKCFFILGMFLVVPQGVFAPPTLLPKKLKQLTAPFVDQNGNMMSFNYETAEVREANEDERECFEDILDMRQRRNMKLNREDAIWSITREAYETLLSRGGVSLLKKYAGVSRFPRGWTRDKYIEQWKKENENEDENEDEKSETK